jgi:pimeloyl-ACP methyl ester carboxylesterase
MARPLVRLALICSLALASLPLASAANAETSPAPALPTIAWGHCAPLPGDLPGLQCAKVSVPLDWTKPNGVHIKLAVARLPASDQKHRIGSMFLNPGGPGQSGVELVRQAGAEIGQRWGNDRFDMVGWDPRGTNDSDPVRCFTTQAAENKFWQGVQVPMTAAQSAAYALRTKDLARRCGQVSGNLLNNISTDFTARDLDYLRQLVGDRGLTYAGLSYGTFIGETYANLFPSKVRAMMLDAVIDPMTYTKGAEERFARSVGSADEVFTQFVALCQGAGPARCALANHPGTVAQRVAALFARAKKAPIPAPHAKPAGVLNYTDLLLTTFQPLRDPNTWTDYARQLDAAASGDASALETDARAFRSPAIFSTATTSQAIQCLDAPATQPVSAWPSVIGRLTQAGKLWGPILGWWQWAPCASNWPGHATERYAGPWNAKTKTPILLVNGVYDPATSYRGAKRAEQLLGNAVLLTVATYGHPSYQLPSTCTDKAKARYLVSLVVPRRGSVCGTDVAPFQPGLSEPAGGDPDPGP